MNYPDADISGSIVWIPILEKDNLDAALPSVKTLGDHRINHFYDANKTAGKIIADSVGWNGNIAWDIYLFYLSSVKWADTPPKPASWMHQLKDEWATKSTYRTGVDLDNELATSMDNLFGS
jgi:hypothetical protein